MGTKILTLCKQKFPDMCLLGEVVLSISAWNLMILNLIFNDPRMNLKHLTIEMLEMTEIQ